MKYPRPVTPCIAVDALIRLNGDVESIVLIERKNPPYGWAIPGGFVDVGESLEQAVIREAKEETCLDIKLVKLLGVYSRPDRDPRGHTVTPVYIADATGEPRAADDAKNITVTSPSGHGLKLAFDHNMILQDYINYLETDNVAPLRG